MLTKSDINKIANIVKAGNELVGARIDRLEEYMRQRFDEVDGRIDNVERKIDQLIKTEDEDIQVAYKEIQLLKIRLKKLESKVYSS